MQAKTAPLLTTISFQEAIKEKNFDFIEAHLTKTPDLVNTPNEKGITPLGYAIETGDMKLTQALLKHGDPLIKFIHMDLAYKASNHIKLRKYLRRQLENRYQELNDTPNTLETKQAKMVLAANLSLYFHYGIEDFTGDESFSKKKLDYIIKAEQLFDEILQENHLNSTDLMNLHAKMGEVCLLLESGGINKHYGFLVEKQSELLNNQGYQKTLAKNLGNNLIVLIKNHLKRAMAFEPAPLESHKYARESYCKVLEIADSTPNDIPEKQKFLICYYAGLACRYMGESFEREQNFSQSLAYYLKSIEANSSILNALAQAINGEHISMVQELTRGYRRIYSLYQKGNIRLNELRTGLNTLNLDESKKNILAKKAIFQDENLIAHFYEASKSIHELLGKDSMRAATPFWTTTEDKAETTNPTKLKDTVSNSF